MDRGTNSLRMRKSNEKLILSLVSRGNHSRADIAKITGLTKASVTILTDKLITEGLLYECEVDEGYSGVGRKPIILKLNGESRCAIGVDINRSVWSVGACDLGGRELCESISGSSEGDAGDVLKDIARAVKKVAGKLDKEKLLGVGVTTPGPVDSTNGVILTPPAFMAWHGVKVCAILEELTGLSVSLENISGASALAERSFGKCTAEENYAYILVDDGIGSGIVTGGRLYRGKNGFGSELGHTSIDMNGEMCECGNRGCLERYASIPSLLKYRRHTTWLEASQNESVVRKEASYLSTALINLVNLFDLETIILGGAIAENGQELARLVEEKINYGNIAEREVLVSVCTPLPKAVVSAGVKIEELFA